MEDAFPRCVDDPLCAVAADDAGDAGVRDGNALPDDASQTMAALGLHHEINVLPRSEARAEGDGQRGHIPRRAEISLRKDGVHDNGGPHLRDQLSLRVHHHRHIAAAPDDHGLVRRQLTEAGADPVRVEGLHAPIGLAIGGQTAPEIALSILAEIVQVKNSRQQTEGFPPALLNALDACAGQETPPVLVTIVSRHGSTPREVGAKMLMLPDGKCVGSVGGGIMEYRIQQLASKMQAGEAAPCQLAEYSASAQEDDAALAACGGSMKVFLQLLKEEKSDEA